MLEQNKYYQFYVVCKRRCIVAYESCIPWTPRVWFLPEVQLTVYKRVSKRSKFPESARFQCSGTRYSGRSVLNAEMKLLRSFCVSTELSPQDTILAGRSRVLNSVSLYCNKPY